MLIPFLKKGWFLWLIGINPYNPQVTAQQYRQYPYYPEYAGEQYRQNDPNIPQPPHLGQPYGTRFSQFRPNQPSAQDQLILPKGYKYDIVATWGEDLGNGEKFGFNNDFTCYFGSNPNEGLLWVNHEYIGHMSIFVTGYKEEPGGPKRTPQQIATEKYNLGGSVIHICKGAQGNWSIVKGSRYNRRITGTTPINLTGPAALLYIVVMMQMTNVFTNLSVMTYINQH